MVDSSFTVNSKRRTQCQRLSLIALLTWFSSSNAGYQHRVKKPSRVLEYRHVLENRRRGEYKKFRIPSRQHGERRLRGNPNFTPQVQQDVIEDEIAWNLWVQGDGVDDESFANNEDNVIDDAEFFSSAFGPLRSLFEQFIGQDTPPQDTNATNSFSRNNVTTEVSNATLNETAIYTTSDSNVTDTMGNETNTVDEAVDVFKPIRLRAILAQTEGNGDWLSEDERISLFLDILSPALLSWSNTLRVDPVVGNLTVDMAQLMDGQTCGPGLESGLPSIRVPLSHLEEGVPDTDMIVYLSLGFVSATENQNNNTYNDTDAAVDQEPENRSRALKRYLPGRSPESEFHQRTIVASLPLSDRGKRYSEEFEPDAICTGSNLAAASFCSTDQYDRPTAALLHICIDEFFFEPKRRSANIQTIMHELGHALGFNSLSMAHFRRLDGTPYTERVDGDIPDTEIECTGPHVESGRKRAKVALPSEEILQFRETRGGVRVAELVTPSVVQVVRNHFGCQNLSGAELESGDGLPLTSAVDDYGCLGDHWERRLFSGDIMNPIVDDMEYSPGISTLTLAYFADSGWYQVDLAGSRVASGWGRGVGCGFVNEACIGRDGQVPPGNAEYFCNEIPHPFSQGVATQIHGCTPDLSRKAVCSMGHYGLDLPWEYRYFQETYGSDVGGHDSFLDFCPVFTGFEDGLCSRADTRNFMLASPIERFGERNSRCLMGNPNRKSQQPMALCLPIACVVEDRSLRVNIGNTWHLCQESGQIVGQGGASVVCPDPRRVCPTFYCPYDCLGTAGQCDYGSGRCLCEFEGFFRDNATILMPCDATGDEDDNPAGSFFRSEPIRDYLSLPHPDTAISAYYFPTERALIESGGSVLGTWAMALIVVAASFAVSIVVWYVATSRPELNPSNLAAWFKRKNVEENEAETTEPFYRNKDKMIATVLVDMRIRSGQSSDNSPHSVADTEEQLTDSEASRGAPSEVFSERASTRSSDSLADVDTSLDDTPEDLPEETPVMRRRRQVVHGGAPT